LFGRVRADDDRHDLIAPEKPGQRHFGNGFAAFLGFLGLLVGLGKILALWGLLELLS